jgi:L-ascorbate metabolism protein UlaG (beta-lactamase superfamily)
LNLPEALPSGLRKEFAVFDLALFKIITANYLGKQQIFIRKSIQVAADNPKHAQFSGEEFSKSLTTIFHFRRSAMSIKVTWFGHASLSLEIGDKKILIDPYFSDNPAASTTAANVNADYILISHGHGDHVGDAVSIAKRTGALVVSNFEIANWFNKQGISNTHAQHIGGGYTYPFGYVKLTQAFHGSAMPDGSYGGNPAGFLITTNEGPKLYFACDTGLFSDMSLYGDEGLDLAVLPIGDNFTMGPDDALKAVKFLRPKHVIPVHYNTWEPIEQDPQAWAKRVEAETSAKVHVIKPGESFSL